MIIQGYKVVKKGTVFGQVLEYVEKPLLAHKTLGVRKKGGVQQNMGQWRMMGVQKAYNTMRENAQINGSLKKDPVAGQGE